MLIIFSPPSQTPKVNSLLAHWQSLLNLACSWPSFPCRTFHSLSHDKDIKSVNIAVAVTDGCGKYAWYKVKLLYFGSRTKLCDRAATLGYVLQGLAGIWKTSANFMARPFDKLLICFDSKLRLLKESLYFFLWCWWRNVKPPKRRSKRKVVFFAHTLFLRVSPPYWTPFYFQKMWVYYYTWVILQEQSWG